MNLSLLIKLFIKLFVHAQKGLINNAPSIFPSND